MFTNYYSDLRFSSESVVLLPFNDNQLSFRNITVTTLRFFILIKSIQPVQLNVFQEGLMLLDQVYIFGFFHL